MVSSGGDSFFFNATGRAGVGRVRVENIVGPGGGGAGEIRVIAPLIETAPK